MPMLITLRMRLPVWPVHAPARTRFAKSAIRSRTAWTSGTTFAPSTTIEAFSAARNATCRTARFSVTLIFSPAEHRVDPRMELAFLGELDQEREGLVGDSVLRVVEIHARRFDRHPPATFRIGGEERTQMKVAHFRQMGPKRLPRRTRAKRWLRCCRHHRRLFDTRRSAGARLAGLHSDALFLPAPRRRAGPLRRYDPLLRGDRGVALLGLRP